MYSIFIADDEAIIRQGIQCLLDYEALGYRICGEAATGEQALEGLLTLKPDVALMDIRMPGLSGLDTVRLAREQGYTGKIIIVSSYTDFKYAQEAIRCGVQHYITKPIDEDELKRILEEFAEILDQEAHQLHTSREYLEHARHAVLSELLLHNRQPDPAHAKELGLQADSYQILLLERGGDRSELRIGSRETLAYDHLMLPQGEVLLLKGASAIARFHELIDFHLRSYHGQNSAPFFACGPQVATLAQLPESYEGAVALKQRRFFCDAGQNILTVDDLPTPTVSSALNPEQVDHYASTLLACIQSFNRREMVSTLQSLQQLLHSAPDSIHAIKVFLMDLYLRIRAEMNRLYPESEIPFFTHAEIIHTIEQASYLFEIIQFFSERFELFMVSTGASNRDSVLDDILHYIHHNYSGNITLESIAPLFGYNRSYLGKIFTKKIGQNFNSYVDHVRIEKSKEYLLKDNTKVYIIAERVGYKNVDYFHIKFKKYVGMSPAEFRRQNKE